MKYKYKMYTRGSAANYRVPKNASKDLFSRHREIRDNKVSKNKVKKTHNTAQNVDSPSSLESLIVFAGNSTNRMVPNNHDADETCLSLDMMDSETELDDVNIDIDIADTSKSNAQ